MSKRSAVIISPHFPPSTLAGVHRARHLAKHLPAAGWHPIVLCVDKAYHTERLDPALARLVPADTEIVKTAAFAAKPLRAFGVGDIGIRAFFQIRAALFRLLATRPVDAVMITGAPFYPMLLAPEIKRRFGTAVILDFQDPWLSAHGASHPALSKAGAVHRLAQMLEPRAIHAADFVTSVSEVQNEQLRARYSWLAAGKMAAIPIGGDPEDFEALRGLAVQPELSGMASGVVNLSYVGTFLPRAGLLVETLFRALRLLRSREPALAERIKLNFIGTSNQPDGFRAYRVAGLAGEVGVKDLAHEIPNRLPFLDALAWMARSDGLLLIGSDEPHYTASKIYPALMSGRPYLSLFHSASSAHRILSEASGGLTFAFETPEQLTALVEPLAGALRRLALSPETFAPAKRSAYETQEAANIARRFAEVFDVAVRAARKA